MRRGHPGTRLLLAGFVLLLLALNGWIFWSNIGTLLDEQGLINSTQHTRTVLDQMGTSLDEAETGQRGYLLTGQAQYLQPYTAARARVLPTLAQLQPLLRHDATQQRLLSELRPLVQAKLAELQATITLYRTKGSAPAIELVRSNKGQVLINQIRALLTRLQNNLTAMLTVRTHNATAAAQTARLTLLLATAIDAVLLGGLVFLLQRNAGRAQQAAAERSALLASEHDARIAAEEERRAAEQERERLRQVLDAVPVGVVVLDASGRVAALSRVAASIVGADVLGTDVLADAARLGALAVRHDDGTPYALEEQPLYRSLRSGEPVRHEEGVIRQAGTGKDIPLLISSVPLRDRDGRSAGAVAVYQDISAIKDVEREKHEFLNTVSHDLKNPITSILGTAQLLQRRANRMDEVERSRIAPGLAAIEQAARGMTQQVSELLDVSRLQMGRSLELDPAPFDLVRLVRELAQEYGAMNPRHTLCVTTDHDALSCLCDGTRLRRALANLIANSIKYSSGGTIEIALALEQHEGGAWAVIRVSDEGVGIPPAELPRVFERFYRASNVGQISGTGIGLAGVRQIVEVHGGTIAITSDLGVGTTVTIRLPLGGPAPSAPQPETAPES